MNRGLDILIEGSRKLGVYLTSKQVDQFETYYQEIIEWRNKVNITAILEYNEIQVKHFLDSVALLQIIPCIASLKIIDVGSGAGFPGIPLKIICPSIQLTLLESIGKKVNFLNHIVTKLELYDVEVVKERAESLAHSEHYREQYDIALTRALGSVSVIAELTLPLCKIGGLSIAYKKGEISQEINNSLKALNILAGCLKDVKKVMLDEFDGERLFVIMEKVSPTPLHYPRRAGIPSRRPL